MFGYDCLSKNEENRLTVGGVDISYLAEKYGTPLYIMDEDKLRAALEKDPREAMNVFMSLSESADPATAYKENGLLHRMNNLMNTYIKGRGKSSLDALERSIRDTSQKLDKMERKMLDIEETYYLKYAALEEAMSTMNSQSDWLASTMSSLMP